MGRKVLKNGRSGASVLPGRARKWKPEPPFICHPRSLLTNAGFQALSSPARRVLDFIELEHLAHGGMENGRLLAPYAQLEAFGVSSRDIRPALEMLEAFGIVRCTTRGERLGGRTKASTYALTFYPTWDGALPTEDYRSISQEDVVAMLGEWKRLRSLRETRRAARAAAPTAEI